MIIIVVVAAVEAVVVAHCQMKTSIVAQITDCKLKVIKSLRLLLFPLDCDMIQ